jgi:acyl carrier protein
VSARMERAEVLEVMRDKAVEMLEVPAEALQEDKSFVADLQVDSLSLVEYTMDLEDALGIELPEEELEGLQTIGAFLDVIMSKLDTALNSDG